MDDDGGNDYNFLMTEWMIIAVMITIFLRKELMKMVVMITILMMIEWKMMVVSDCQKGNWCLFARWPFCLYTSALSTRRVGKMMTRMRMIIRIILMAVVMLIALTILKKLPSEIGSLRNED